MTDLSPIRPNSVTTLSPEIQARLATATDFQRVLHEEAARLRGDLRTLGSFLPTTIVRQQLAAPAQPLVRGAYWNGTVLFADLSGFTALSEQLSALGKQGAEEISTIINQLFGTLADEILRYGGEVLKFGGDALTAFFDQAALGDTHATLATRAALALNYAMAAFEATATRAGVFRLRLRIGVHSGRVFAAQLGDAEHIELVVTGRNINRVALAQEIAEPGQIIISSATSDLLEGATCEPRQSGFYLLQGLDNLSAPNTAASPLLADGAGDIAEIVWLEQQVAALNPFLPRNLPRRFLEENQGASGEFRPVSVLFANFYPFSNALDVLGDDTQTAVQVLNAYYRRAQQVVHRYGGIVNKIDLYTYGDKLMALFGAPTAHENDAELAVRAALDLKRALQQANAEIATLLQPAVRGLIAIDDHTIGQRMGINTGVMFAGLVGGTRRREYTVMGQHVNLAARLMSAADESAVMVSPSTRRSVERHIALRQLEPVKLKGIAEPVPISEALRAFDVSQDQPRSLGRARLVGRSAEVALLLGDAEAALGGAGRVAALVGEAGVGKSRLLEDVLRQLVMQSGERGSPIPAFFPYSVECQSYEQNTPYALTRQVLRQVLHLDFLEGAGDAAVVQRRVVELAPDLERFTPLLADLTVTQIEDTALTAALTPEQRHDRALELAESLVRSAASQQPLVLIIDDLHWADASSLELIDRLARSVAQSPLLLLLGYRTDPSISEPWASFAHGRRLELRELDAAGSAMLIGELLGSEPPAELTAALEKTQGNPFFIEEVVRGLIEAGVLARDPNSGWWLTRAIDEETVPDSIEGVITARLDRLEERSREVLQVASVVGRRFPYQVLLGVLLRSDDLQERLGRLSDADLILIEEIERELAYLFKHALTRDVAYEAILYARRRELHRNVARQIERIYPERLDEQLGVLARHYLLAEEWVPAFDYHIRAGRQAQNRYANREAIGFFERALHIAAKGPVAENLAVITVELHERLGVIHTLIGEYGPALAHFGQAHALLEALPNRSLDELVRLHHQIARVYEKRADFDTAFRWVEAALSHDAAVASAEAVRCLLLGAGLHRRQGRFAQALEWGERALARAEQLHSIRDQAEALMLLGGTYLGMGDNDRALALTEQCLELYKQVQNLPRVADAHNNLANICYELGRLDEAQANYQAGFEIKQAIGDIYGQAMIANNLGNLLKLLGNSDRAVEQYQRSLIMFEKLGSVYATGVLHMNLGAAYLLADVFDRAEYHLGRSVELFAQAGAEDFLPELERNIAELQLRRGDLPRALLACELALATAARLEARAEEAVTRRVYAQALAQYGDYQTAWQELQQSLTVLREVNNRYETARTLGVLAQIAPQLDQHAEGQAALDQAVALLQALGATYDVIQLMALAQQQGYMMQSTI